MSLVTSASPWSNDEPQKKRIPSMRKTAKKLPSPINTIGEPDEYVSQDTVYQETQGNSIADVQAIQEDRNNRVNQLINQMDNSSLGENDGNQLANFKPLSHPIIQKRTDTIDVNVQGRVGDPSIPLANNPLQIPPPPIRQNPGGSNFSANSSSSDLGNLTTKPYSNYRKIYEPSKMMAPTDSYTTMNGSGSVAGSGSGNQSMDHKLLEKINYMVHMLEQQHNERTSNITEEFVLYTFLGVFIIFIVDSFARAGKYTR